MLRDRLEHLPVAEARALRLVLSDVNTRDFLREIEPGLLRDELTPEQLRVLISLMLLVVKSKMGDYDGFNQESLANKTQPSLHHAACAANV